MGDSFITIDRNTPMLLPPDLREWVPSDDMVHFVLEAVADIPLSAFQVNRRGSGDRQFPPRAMLALLIYCYANGVFGSRRIERATYRDVAVRYLMADTHPDHSTICLFRRQNVQAVMRLCRIGQKNPVRVRVFSLYGSVDEHVTDVLTNKTRELAKIL